MTASGGSRLSLKARAIGLLSRREHSRSELRRKLAAHAEDPLQLESLLNDLEQGNWLSEERFAENLVHRRAPRHGVRRIMQELRQHKLPEDSLVELEAQLRDTEPERAHAVWSKRFSAAPADAKEYARQLRYMAARGFTAESLRGILAQEANALHDDLSPFDPSD